MTKKTAILGDDQWSKGMQRCWDLLVSACAILLAAVWLPGVGLLYVLAWELWRCAKRAEP